MDLCYLYFRLRYLQHRHSLVRWVHGLSRGPALCFRMGTFRKVGCRILVHLNHLHWLLLVVWSRPMPHSETSSFHWLQPMVRQSWKLQVAILTLCCVKSGLYFISSFMHFEPWHMFTCFLQYMFFLPSCEYLPLTLTHVLTMYLTPRCQHFELVSGIGWQLLYWLRSIPCCSDV